jgi:GntR family transcriptional regulator, vanillate catabolism transcriptional regulator
MANEGQRVLSRLRQMIITGELAAGERLIEIHAAEQLGVSRMPIRMAFRTLEQEGLLTKLPRRGYRVREVTDEEIHGAIEVRGVLEGLAAARVAQKGLSESQKNQLMVCLGRGDSLFQKGYITEQDLEAYHDINQQFHSTIIEASGNPTISAALARNEYLPFASVSALAFDSKHLDQEFRRFNYAHMQHHAIFNAIINNQASRAESIMREHANATLRYAELFTALSEESLEVKLIGIQSREISKSA